MPSIDTAVVHYKTLCAHTNKHAYVAMSHYFHAKDVQQYGMGFSSPTTQVCSSCRFACAVHTLIPFPYTSWPGTALTSMYTIGKLQEQDNGQLP